MRELVEGTRLSYGAISKKTGIGRASICRWAQDGGWVRPAGAPVATDTAGSRRASIRLQARTLHRRAQALAERLLDGLEKDPSVGREELFTALEMLKTAKLARMPKRRQRAGEPKPEVANAPLLAMNDASEPPRARGRPRKDDLPVAHLPEVLDRHRQAMRKLRVPRRERAHLAMLAPDRPAKR